MASVIRCFLYNFLFYMVLIFFAVSAAHAVSIYPHYLQNEIDCTSCHDVYGTEPKLLPPWTSLQVQQNIDDAQFNRLCWSCHNELGSVDPPFVIAPYVVTHSSRQADDSYGNWTVQCVVCHDPHFQRQAMTYTSTDDYIEEGVSTGIGPTTITKTGAGWEDDAFQGLVVYPNKNVMYYSYKIISNTSDTLTVDPGVPDGDPETMDLSFAKAGDTFVISYGKLIRAGNSPVDLGRIERYSDPDAVPPVLDTSPYKSGLKSPKFIAPVGDNSFADGDATFDGVCEICHTETNYHRNDGSADQSHNPRTDCTRCHSHLNGFMHGSGSEGCVECHGHDAGSEYDPDMSYPPTLQGGSSSQGAGSYWSHSTHTEFDSDDKIGPQIYCDTCHYTDDMPLFKNQNGSGPYSLTETNICDNCHSPGGSYDGVNDPVIGAKANWYNNPDGDSGSGIYWNAGGVRKLKTGKEKWCGGCHDDDASNSRVNNSGVPAPNVIGNENEDYTYGVGWGYFKTGHGLPGSENYPSKGGLETLAGRPIFCDSCHDFNTVHIDHAARTFDCGDGCDPTEYRESYRLKQIDGHEPMEVPWPGNQPGSNDVGQYRLCASCHATEPSNPFTDGSNMDTNMRKCTAWDTTDPDNPICTEYTNYHYVHLNNKDAKYPADYNYGSVNSEMTCVVCHNVHGSTRLAMIRDGKLIDREPGLEMWYTNTGDGISDTGSDPPEPQDLPLSVSDGKWWHGYSASNLCDHCHGGNKAGKRLPYQIQSIAPMLDWTGETGFTDDGAYPDTAETGSLFTFRVRYTDLNNDPPAPIELWIDLNDDEDFDDTGEKLVMAGADAGDTYYYNGKLYTLTLEVNSAGDDDVIDYLFHASDDGGTTEATGVDHVVKSITLEPATNHPPELAWVSGTCRDRGVSPYVGISGSDFTFYVSYTDADDNAPNPSVEVWVDLNDDGDFDDTVGGTAEKQVMIVDGGNGIYDDGENYTRTLAIDYAGDGTLNYRFVASDGTDPATGEPTGDHTFTVVDNSAPGGIYYVYETDPTPGNPNTFDNIQGAIDAVDGDHTVLVDAGTYAEITYNGNDNNTVVRSICGPEYTIIQGDNTQRVVNFTSSFGIEAVLDGFQVTNGTRGVETIRAIPTIKNCWIHGNTSAGGLVISDPLDPLSLSRRPTVIDSKIYNNSSTNGGGVYVNTFDTADFYDTLIYGNTATDWGGGGAFINGPVTFTNCTIRDNLASGSAGAGNGGGIYMNTSGEIDVFKSTIIGNTAANVGGGVHIAGGPFNMTNSILAQNSAVKGGGVSDHGSLKVLNSTIAHNETMADGDDLTSLEHGGAIYVNNGSFTIINSVVWSNKAHSNQGHIAYFINGSGAISDSIVSNDTDTGFDDYPYFDGNRKPSTTGFLSGNDPLFVDAANRDYHIQDISPAIDNAKIDYAPIDDIDGDARPQKAGYDIGADEVPGTLNGNNVPFLKWTGEPDFTDDGVNPDSDACGSTFEFRVNYTDADNEAPDPIQIWVDLNDDGDYEDIGEKQEMTLVGDGDGNYTNGENFTKNMALEYGQDGNIKYRFVAFDGTSYAFGTPTGNSSLTVTGPTVTLISGDHSIDESGVGPGGEGTISLELSAASNCDVVVPFTFFGTASGSGTDYSNTAVPVTIEKGNTTGSITIVSVSDTLDEEDETIEVYMGTPTNAAKGATTENTVTITDDDDPPTVVFASAGQSTADESGIVLVTAELSTESGKTVTVPFTINASSTAEGSGTDYTISQSEIVIPAGSPSESLSIAIATDSLDEIDETIVVDMGTPVNATKGTTFTTHTVTITDDDDPPTVDFTSGSQATFDESGTATITAQLSAVSGRDVTVPFSIDNDSSTAVKDEDYDISPDPDSETLFIPAGSTTADITVTIAQDSNDEGDSETVVIYMGSPTNAIQGTTTQHTLTITDDDEPGLPPLTVHCEPDGSGGWLDYDLIQDAMNAVDETSDHRVKVCDDTYDENITFDTATVDPYIILMSEEGASPLIQGTGAPNAVVTFPNATNAILEGFTIDNKSGTADNARGIKITGGATPTIRNCIITDNLLNTNNTWDSNSGGGIYINGGGATIENSLIGEDSSENPAGNTAGRGAGIYAINGLDLTISDSKIRYNTGRDAPGIYLESMVGTTTLTNTNVDNNSNGKSYPAGGIYAYQSSLSITGGTVSNNQGRQGAGLYLIDAPTVTEINNVLIDNNAASGTTNYSGAGIYSSNSPLAISNGTTISNNTGRHGAGLYLTGNYSGFPAGTRTIIDGTTIDNNSSGDYEGGGIFSNTCPLSISNDSFITNNDGRNGSGMYLSSLSEITVLDRVTITGNTTNGGYSGAGIYSSESPMTITNSNISDNTSGKAGAGIYISGAYAAYPAGTVNTISVSTLNNNNVTWDNESGGAIYTSSPLEIHRSYIQGNRSGYGGGIRTGAPLTVTNSIITGNSADRGTGIDGGGIYGNADTVIINSTISGNFADDAGGGLFGNAAVTNSIIYGNITGAGTNQEYGGSPTFTYSNVYGLLPLSDGNIDQPPQFVDYQQAGSGTPTDAGDFRICGGVDVPVAGCTTASPVIDAGTFTDAPTDDIEGQPRPLGSGIDMGADEFAYIITVTKEADTRDGTCDADCSLREAVDAANAASSPVLVSIPAGTYTITLAGVENGNASGDYDVSSSTAFAGAGEGVTSIVGVDGDRVFHDVGAGVNLAFSNLTIKDNDYSGANGGCVSVAGDRITVNDTTFDNCDAENGGAIFADSSSTVSITDSTFTNCDATNVGGAVRAWAMTLTDSAFTSNSAGSNGGAIFTSGAMTFSGQNTFTTNTSTNANGGAIYSDVNLTVDGAVFDGNISKTRGGAVTAWNGGSTCCSLTVTDSIFTNNQTDDMGGAIFARKQQTAITTSIFTGNKSTGTSATGRGGAAWCNEGFAITGSTFTNNQAQGGNTSGQGDGGALWADAASSIKTSTFNGNTAGHSGGALYLEGDSATIINSTISGNSSANNGGGLWSGTCTIKNATFAGNASIGGTVDSINAGSCDIYNTIITNGSSSKNNCSAAYTPDRYNIENKDTCGFTGINDQNTTDPLLLGLADNGGPTETHALQTSPSTSPAIDTGDNTICADADVNNVDQRGVTRPQNVTCDIGAFEYAP